MSNTAVIQLHEREEFERNVTRALAAGAGAGLIAFLSNRLHVPVPFSFLAIAATSLACVRGVRAEKAVLAFLSVLLPAVPWLFGMSNGWTVAMAGAVAGAIIVKSRLAERGEEGSVGADRPALFHYVATAVSTGGLALAGTEIANILFARLQDVSTPLPLAFASAGTVVGLFAGLGTLASHIALKADPVEARCEEVLPTLSGEFQMQTTRALTLYRHCGQSLAALPRDAAREELARTIGKLTRDAVELAAEWAGVEAQLHEEAHADLQKEVAELRSSAKAAKDLVAKRQLEMAANSLTEEIARLDEMTLKRERIVAKLKSQVALLERARVALIGMRSSHTSVRAAEMSAVARKLNSLALSQADEAKLAHAVATSAELAAHESALHEAKVRETFQAVAPVGSAETEVPETTSVKE
jgi:hypothetical protein